ncbi:MAG: hypothetical protein AB7G38_14535 [Dehalococcoidia bacterium]
MTEEEVDAKLRELGLSILPEELAPLTIGVNRVMEMTAANREVITDQMAPVLLVKPARRPVKGS